MPVHLESNRRRCRARDETSRVRLETAFGFASDELASVECPFGSARSVDIQSRVFGTREVNAPSATTRLRARRAWIGVLALVVIAVAVGGWYMFGRDHHETADNAMAARAQQVMPFDLNRTMHTFTQSAAGGVEKVVVKEPSDTHNRDLIRTHLQTEAENFRQGNYTDPAKIHGMDMPGVDDLEQGAARVEVVFAEIPHGARITYTSTEAKLISAIHAWFDRQASDHSMTGMGG